MAGLRVLVSSTAYDFAILRSSMRRFIEQQGFDPVLSEYSDILYDFREHTHRSCLEEVTHCDMLVLIIGSRFGSELTDEEAAELTGEIDASMLQGANPGQRLSITQAEALTAVINRVPVFAFIESGVNHDYQTYRQNRGKPFASEIEYASISKPGTAEYIFSFVELLKKRRENNALIVFDKVDDIYLHLQKQWSALFQRLLSEARDRQTELVRIDRLADQFEDLKATLLSTIGADRRQVARATIRFRGLFAFLKAIPNSGLLIGEAILRDYPWEELLHAVASITAVDRFAEATNRWTSILHREGHDSYVCELTLDALSGLRDEWTDFARLDQATREAVFEELLASIKPSELVLVSPMSANASPEPREPNSPSHMGGSLREREINTAGPILNAGGSPISMTTGSEAEKPSEE